MFDFLNSLGFIPDVLRGKKPGQALVDNVAAVTTATAGANLPGMDIFSGGVPKLGQGAGTMPTQPTAAPGLLDQAMSGMDKYGKPLNTAMSIANQTQGLLGQPSPQAQPTVGVMRPGPDAMQGLLAQNQQIEQQRQQERLMRQLQSSGLFGRAGGLLG